MILHLFKRALKEHFGFHLLIPVLLIFAISAWPEQSLRTGGSKAWLDFAWNWPGSQLGKLAEVYGAFFLVVAWSIKLAGDVQSSRVETVRDVLPTTKRYFAIGVIPLREWFEPNTAVYLSTVIQHQIAHPDFSHERVLLFTRDSELKAVSVSYLDEPHAKALAAIHRQFSIPLSYLPPDAYASLVTGLGAAERRKLRCERRIMSWVRARIPWLPVEWTLRRVDPFVLLEQNDGTHMAMRFDKHKRTLTLTPVNDAAFVEAAKLFVDRISAVVYRSGTRTLLERYTFINLLQPWACPDSADFLQKETAMSGPATKSDPNLPH